MGTSLVTRASLLLRIRDPKDRIAWAEFVRLYAPLVHAYGRRHGFQDCDAADLTQEVLRLVARSAPGFSYDPARGTFRGWLLTVTRNAVRKLATRNARAAGAAADTEIRRLLEQQADRSDEDRWRQDYQWRLFQWAADRVRGEFREATWQAFWDTAVLARDIREVARSLRVSTGAVYIARSRVTARIRTEIQAVEGDRDGAP
jgi:RNA polymerase sigma-70 factor (ECF subfamily)